jgi:serine/threonine-protein kinase
MHPFGDAAVRLGLATPPQVAECLALEDERLKVGDARTLPEILQERGYLTAEQTSAVFASMGVPPHIIAGYELLAPVGRGGMGEVYRARQVKMNRIVAVKFLSDELAADADYVKRFFAEARTAAQFNHRNLVAAYDAGAVDGRVYFVMEYVEGRSLRDALERHGPLPERQAILVAAGVVEALRALEQHGTVHRDIKPENVMIDAAGLVKLCDFGLARARGKAGAGTTGASIVGTPHYMPPEQIRGDALDIIAST